MYKIKNFNAEQFLHHYWQKKPLVIKHAFADFQDPLDAKDLAGLAQEMGIDSRIVSRQGNKWQVNQGPFEGFSSVTHGAWTLLVQGVDKYLSGADELLRAFSFIPDWRVDDLMVSFSVKGAGVGPHLDQYDVFIVQGKGSRRWQVGSVGEYEEFLPNPHLKQITSFEPVIDEILSPGDIIYIPPGYPHNGVALDDCMNYSIGFRAPSQNELLSGFADYALDTDVFTDRYQDPDLQVRTLPNEIKQQEVNKIRSLMVDMIDSVHFEDWLCRFLSKPDLEHEFQLEPEESYTADEIRQLIEQNTYFIKNLGVKTIIKQTESGEKSEVLVYVNENVFEVPKKHLKHVSFLLNEAKWCANPEITYENSIFFVHFVTTLVNEGCWYPE